MKPNNQCCGSMTFFGVESQSSRNQGFSYYFCLVIEGSGSEAGSKSGFIRLTNGSGSGSRRPGSGSGFGSGSATLQITKKHLECCLKAHLSSACRPGCRPEWEHRWRPWRPGVRCWRPGLGRLWPRPPAWGAGRPCQAWSWGRRSGGGWGWASS